MSLRSANFASPSVLTQDSQGPQTVASHPALTTGSDSVHRFATINTSTGGNLGERNLSSASSVGLVERSKNGTTSCVFQVRLMIRAESR
jgi:hypothetical protein